jgi:thiamine biosynthesis lipoprotein
MVNRKPNVIFIMLLVYCLLIFQSCRGTEKEADLVVIDGLTMGTTYTVKVVRNSKPSPDSGRADFSNLKVGIEKVLNIVNRHMSIFVPDSEISRFNRFRSTDWFAISLDTAKVIAQAILVSEKSGGAFDITVGPLVNLWGFGTGSVHGIPDEDDIRNNLKFIGYQNISVRLSPPSVKKRIKEISLDLAAIAKGYGVDCVAEFLDSEKVAGYLVEIGGEVRAKGKSQHNRWWRIGIASPTSSFGVQKVMDLENLSMATSGDYRNYFEEKGIRYSHTIDPQTGKPITHSLASVTVVDRICMAADAMATALNVLGPDKGYDLAVKENLAAYFIIKSGNTFIEKSTPKFTKLLKSEGEQN